MIDRATPVWKAADVRAPGLQAPVPVVVAHGVPYFEGANRLQTLSLYMPATTATRSLEGEGVTSLPGSGSDRAPSYQVHVHGGAWRDPMTDARSIEAAVALTFADPDATPIRAVASLNYTLTQFPNHPVAPYSAEADGHADPARESVHPRHVADVYAGLEMLRSLGLTDGSYILTGHSCGACIAFQAALAHPATFGLTGVNEPPVPAAVVGINGLYDLPGLVLGLGPSHEVNSHDYRVMLNNAYGPDDRVWAQASPARLDSKAIEARIRSGRAPALAWLAQSPDDQLVPMSQLERLADNLKKVNGLRLEIGTCSGKHATPWQTGLAIQEAARDALRLLSS